MHSFISPLCSNPKRLAANLARRLHALAKLPVYWGRSAGASTPTNSLILFPLDPARLACGLAGIVAINRRPPAPDRPEIKKL